MIAKGPKYFWKHCRSTYFRGGPSTLVLLGSIWAGQFQYFKTCGQLVLFSEEN